MEEQTTQGIDLSVFLHNFRRTLQHFFWVPIVLGLLLGGMSWLRAARSYAPVYQSSAVFSVSAGFSSSTDILSHSTYLDSNAAAQLSATFPYVLQSDRMQLLLQQELGDQRAPVSLSASSVADAALFTLTATGSDPQAVYDTLLAAIEVYPAAATTILGDTQIQVIDQPVEPSAAPINANTALQTGIRRGVVGLVLGLVLVALLSLTRRTVHSAEDLHRLISLSCLSSIPAVRRGKRTRREAPSLLLTHAGTGSDFSEAMRNLSLKLQRITSKHGAKVVLITSTVPGEGKTTVASNLALALAAEGKRVILIDGDLRKQSLKPLFGIGAHSDGLVEVLSGKAKNFRLLPVPDSSLLLLSGDGTVAQPQRLLGSPRMGQILELLRNLKDKINSSIMLITHDLGVIAEMADYVVVMYAGRVVEKGTAQEIFANPAHPYTIGLMASKPMVGKKVDKLYSIPGKVPNPINMPNYCYFKDRCEMCVEGCQGEYPHMIQLSPTHMVSCYRYYGKEDAQNG